MKIPNLTSFVLEGPDKVGKATQSNLLVAAIDDLKLRCHLIEVPSKSHACYDKIYDMLKRRGDGSAPARDHPEIFQTYQAANRFHIQEDLRRMAQDGNMIVVFDRWHISSWVYGLAAGMHPSKLHVISEGMLDVDVTFVLNGRGFDRPEVEDDAHEDDSSFQSKIRADYGELEGVVHIDADRPKKIVQDELFTIAKRHLINAAIL